MVAERRENNKEESSIKLTGSRVRPLFLRIFCVFLTLASAAALSYHLYTLVVRYKKEPVTIQTSNSKFRFPDIHVCPQVPFSDSIIRIMKQRNNLSEWREIVTALRQMEATMKYYPVPGMYVELHHRVVTRAFWQTLDPAVLHRLLSLPIYESIVRLKVNDVGEKNSSCHNLYELLHTSIEWPLY